MVIVGCLNVVELRKLDNSEDEVYRSKIVNAPFKEFTVGNQLLEHELTLYCTYIFQLMP